MRKSALVNLFRFPCLSSSGSTKAGSEYPLVNLNCCFGTFVLAESTAKSSFFKLFFLKVHTIGHIIVFDMNTHNKVNI